ncbi:MAG: two-component regulator propeller domain-containing protein [Ferruginibacter sp.]
MFRITAQQITTRLYTAKDGLASTYTYAACQDKHGYLWVGTPEGLSRFDGKNFTNYGLADGLPDSRTLRSFMDSHGRYWVATPKGMAEFRGGKFINYPLSDSRKITWVFSFIETKKGELWSATSDGVYKFEGNKWVKIDLCLGYKDHPCRDIIETSEGLYINYGNLLVLEKPGGDCQIIGPYNKTGYHYNYLSVVSGRLLISTTDGLCEIIDRQLVKLPGKAGKLKNTFMYYLDSKKRLWVGAEDLGIQCMLPGDTMNSIVVYKPQILVQHITEDKEGNIWVCTGQGLLRISDVCFQTFTLPAPTTKETLFNVFQPPSGPLLLNSGSLTLQSFEKGLLTGKILKIRGKTLPRNNELIIDRYAFDNRSRYWYIIRGLLLLMQDGTDLYEQGRGLAHLGNEVFDVLFSESRKKIFVAVGTQKYPCQFNDTGYSLMPVVNNAEVKGNIIRLHECANGTMLFSTDSGLVYSINAKNNCKVQLKEFDMKGLVRNFYNDPSGDVWMLYGGRGLRRYTWQQDSLVFRESLTKANGLSSDNVSSLCFDGRNNLWVCTNSNVAVFSNPTHQITSFFDGVDLKIGDAYGARITKDNDNNIWLFSPSNLVCFYPDKISDKPPQPFIQIENLKLNFRETNWRDYADSLVDIFQLPYKPQLSHSDNTLGIYFKGISSSGTDGIKYSYLLEGLNESWSTPSANDFVSFVGLPPAKYIFKVKAQLRNTKWSEPAVFSFVIKKAFWQTWWFYTLSALVLIAAVYVLFRYRLQQKIKLFEMRNRISQDLHDDIGASISGINLLSQMAAEKLQSNKTAEASEYLLKVKNYTQDVIEKLSDMVWVFNPQNDSIDKLLQRLNSFAVSIALSKNIKMHFETDKESEELNLSIQERKAIYLVSKEAINNSFKYAECSNIYYSLFTKGANLQLKIQDDGQGFVPSQKNGGNGLKNMQARADEIGARLNIKSQAGGGTTITLEF